MHAAACMFFVLLVLSDRFPWSSFASSFVKYCFPPFCFVVLFASSLQMSSATSGVLVLMYVLKNCLSGSHRNIDVLQKSFVPSQWLPQNICCGNRWRKYRRMAGPYVCDFAVFYSEWSSLCLWCLSFLPIHQKNIFAFHPISL
jgi:hypothetical protein